MYRSQTVEIRQKRKQRRSHLTLHVFLSLQLQLNRLNRLIIAVSTERVKSMFSTLIHTMRKNINQEMLRNF